MEKEFELGKNLKYKGLEVKWGREKEENGKKAIKKIKRREE